MTGTANSPAPNLSFLYSMMNDSGRGASFIAPQQSEQEELGKGQRAANPTGLLSESSNTPQDAEDSLANVNQLGQGSQATTIIAANRPSSLPYEPASTADADLLLGLHSPYTPGQGASGNATSVTVPQIQSINTSNYQSQPMPDYESAVDIQQQFTAFPNEDLNNMLIRAQEIDMSGAQQFDFSFPGGDMIPWLEYLPQDVLTYFGDQHANGDMVNPPGTLEPG